MHPFITLISLIFLANCAYVSPAALRSLSATNPLEADPADIAVALKLPDGVGLRPGSARLEIEAKNTAIDSSFAESFTLKQSATQAVDIFEIAPADIPRMRSAQTKARMWEDATPDESSGSLSVSATFCKTGDGPAPDARASILIRTEAGGSFMPLIRNAPISEVGESGALGTMEPC